MDVRAAAGEALGSPPTSELGAQTAVGLTPWSQMWMGDDLETVGELQFPQSVQTFASMFNDSQVEALHLGTTLPIRRYRYFLNPQGADPARVKKLAANLNLPMMGEEDVRRGRTRGKFKFSKHVEDALRALYMGFYPFEIVGKVNEEGLWQLTRLGARPPSTVMDINLTTQGDLVSIRQNITQPGIAVRPIPGEFLAWYSWAQEGANVVGRSMLRSIYKNWLIKDRLLRVDAVKHERNGMGVPVATAAESMGTQDLAKLDRLAQRYKAGDTSGGVLPHGATLDLKGVQGSIPDVLASIKYHDEAMARRYLLMFMQLGTTETGSRALGETMVDFFLMSQESIANWLIETFNEQVVERYWDWNYGEDDQDVPCVSWERDESPELAVADLGTMIDKGVVQVDDELEEAVRHALVLPAFKGPAREAPEPTSPPEPTAPGEVQAKRGGRAVRSSAEGSSPPPLLLPDRPLRRQPTQAEVASQVDLKIMESSWQNAVDVLFDTWRSTVTQAQIDELRDAMARTGDLSALASLQATPQGKALLVDAMVSMYESGVTQAREEAIRQGVPIDDVLEPDIAAATKSFETRAEAIDLVTSKTLANMASAKAVSLTGGGLSAQEVSSQVATYLEDLSHAMLKDRLAGAVTQAQNSGRREFMAKAPAATYYASEILDVNTCTPCTGVDGTVYSSIGDTERDYPGGGYASCAGGDRCRGTIVAVYAEGNTSEL